MDGLSPTRALPPSLVGVLFAEDFDAPEGSDPIAGIVQEPDEPEVAEAPIAPEPCEPEVITPSYSAEELDSARQDGHAKGWHEGQLAARDERAETVRLLLSQMAEQSQQAYAKAGDVAEASAECLARLMLQSLAAVLPALCARHGEAEVVAVTRCVLPSLVREARVCVRVNPDVVVELQAALAEFDAEFAARVDVMAHDVMPVGDVRITWQDGEAVRDSGAMLERVTEALALLNDVPELARGEDDQPRLRRPATQQSELTAQGAAHGG